MQLTTNLKQYFPQIREREEVLSDIRKNEKLREQFSSWEEEQRERFLDYCCGNRGVKILYDSFFKEVLNVEYDSSRLEEFLCVILKKKVKIVKILPNDNTRLADETALLITDIVVELEDGTLANVEIQKIGYMFPGARCACYSSDLLLRQYKRIRDRMKENFSYKDIRNVYLIVLFENCPREFKAFPADYYHYGKVTFDTGLDLDMLQEYILIPLDIFKKCMQNKRINAKLEAWLTFFSEDDPGKIVELITDHPQFKAMYQTIYDICLNTERVVEMYSKELHELDRNTARYMVEEYQRIIDQMKEEMAKEREQFHRTEQQLEQEKKQAIDDFQQLKKEYDLMRKQLETKSGSQKDSIES